MIDAPNVDTDTDKNGENIVITDDNADEVLESINKLSR
jgi:hypothetical protein